MLVASRLTELTLHPDRDGDLPLIAPLVNMPMPSLRCLNLYRVMADPKPETIDPSVHIRVELTHDRFPSLRSARLHRTTIPVDLSVLTRLRSIDLSHCTFEDSPNAFTALLDVLGKCAMIETLSLRDVLSQMPGSDVPPSADTPAIRIPRLRELSLWESPACTSTFLARVDLPAIVGITLAATIEEVTEGNTVFSTMLPADLRNVSSTLRAAKDFELTVCGSDMNFSVMTPKLHTLHIELLLPADESWDELLPDRLHEASQLLSEAPLTSIEICGDGDMLEEVHWRALFTQFPNLAELTFDGIGGRPARIFKVLSQLWPNTQEPQLLCPNFAYLAVVGMPWKDSLVRHIKKFLRKRWEISGMLVQLYLKLAFASEEEFRDKQSLCVNEIQSVYGGDFSLEPL